MTEYEAERQHDRLEAETTQLLAQGHAIGDLEIVYSPFPAEPYVRVRPKEGDPMSFEKCTATCENRTKRFLNTYGHDKDGWPMTTHMNVEPNAMRFPIPGTQDMLTVTVTGSGSSAPKPKSRGEEIAGKRIKASNGTGIIFYTPDGEPDVSVVPVSESTQIGTLADLREWFAAAIDEEIAEEREACGEVAEQLPGRRGAMNRQAAALASTLASLIAAAIRARGSK
jgi:hypothetical protein